MEAHLPRCCRKWDGPDPWRDRVLTSRCFPEPDCREKPSTLRSPSFEIHELPSARGCTYVLPAPDFALGLRVGEEFSTGEMRLGPQAGGHRRGNHEARVPQYSMLCGMIRCRLTEIRERTGSASRSLGPEGAKKGLTTTLPLALGRLQVDGTDSTSPNQRQTRPAALSLRAVETEPHGPRFGCLSRSLTPSLARRYFRWIGPATLSEFQWFSGLGVKCSQVCRRTAQPCACGSGKRPLDVCRRSTNSSPSSKSQ